MRSWILVFVVPMSLAASQPSAPVATNEGAILGHPEDWVSPESLAAAVYSVVSGPAGEKRDWNRYRALFRESAPFTTLSVNDGKPIVFGVEEYIEWYGPMFRERGIFEREIWGRTEQFRHVAQRWSTEEFRWGKAGGPADGRSMVSMQFVHDGKRWWIVGMVWEAEDDSNPLPARYLPHGRPETD